MVWAGSGSGTGLSWYPQSAHASKGSDKDRYLPAQAVAKMSVVPVPLKTYTGIGTEFAERSQDKLVYQLFWKLI